MNTVNRILNYAGIRLIRSTAKGIESYRLAKETIALAARANVSVADYVRPFWSDDPDYVSKLVNRMADNGVFGKENPSVLEIGTGTGAYLEEVLTRMKSCTYESYETAQDWVNWLRTQYPMITTRGADGYSLGQTASNSIDITHAHAVFVYLSFLTQYSYWNEMIRVVRTGGYAVFDIITEDCLDEKTIGRWMDSIHRFPTFMTKDYVERLFVSKGFVLIDSFLREYGPGKSEYLIFRRSTDHGR